MKKAWISVPALSAITLLTVMNVPSSASPMGVPQFQSGVVHSCVTNEDAGVGTSNYGYTWHYEGSGGGGDNPYNQAGVVHSYATGGNANVYSQDQGITWQFSPGGPLWCSAP